MMLVITVDSATLRHSEFYVFNENEMRLILDIFILSEAEGKMYIRVREIMPSYRGAVSVVSLDTGPAGDRWLSRTFGELSVVATGSASFTHWLMIGS